MASHGKSPYSKGRRTFLKRGKRSWEGYSKQRVHGFSLAEFLPGKKQSLSSSCWALLLRAPPSGLPTLFINN